jgi:hypothetical protein
VNPWELLFYTGPWGPVIALGIALVAVPLALTVWLLLQPALIEIKVRKLRRKEEPEPAAPVVTLRPVEA